MTEGDVQWESGRDPTILLQQPPDVVSSDPLQQPPVATVSQPPAVDFQQFPPDVVPGRPMEAFGGGGDATYMNQDHQPMYANDNGNSGQGGQATSQKLPSYTNEGGKNSTPWSTVVCHDSRIRTQVSKLEPVTWAVQAKCTAQIHG